MLNTKLYSRILIAGWITIILCLWSTVAYTAPFSGDDGHYLYQSNLLYEHGLMPIRDFISYYSPGYVFWFTGLWKVFGQNHSILLMTIMAGALVSAGALSATLPAGPQRWYGPAIYLPTCLIYEGAQPYLETILLPFACLSYLILKKRNSLKSLILAGSLLGCALMIKQTAVLFLPAFLVGVLSATTVGRIKRLLSFVLGLSLPFLLFCSTLDLNVWNTGLYIASFAHKKYPLPTIGLDFVFCIFIHFWYVSIPMLMAFLWILWRHPREYAVPLLATACAGIPMLFQPFYHYYLLMLPWGTIFLARTLEDLCNFLQQNRLVAYRILSPAILIIIVTAGTILPSRIENLKKIGRIFRTFYGGLDREARNFQYVKADVIAQWYQKYGPLYLFGDPALTFPSGIRIPGDDPVSIYYNTRHFMPQLEQTARDVYPIVTVLRPGNHHSAGPILQFMKTKGFREVDRAEVNEDTLVLLIKNESAH